MAENSKIEWTDATFNPWRGCTKISAGCANCYAESLSGRNPKVLGTWGPNGTRVVAAETGDAGWSAPVKWNRLAAAAKLPDGTPNPDGHRPRVFCASLADVFEEWSGPMTAANGNPLWWCHGSLSNSPIPSTGLEAGCRLATMDDIRARLFDLIGETPNLDWLVLTKRPRHMREWLAGSAVAGLSTGNPHAAAWPFPNVWLGTSVEDQAAAKTRIPELLSIPAAVRFLSVEPLLGPLDISDYLHLYHGHPPKAWPHGRVHWVIVGGESGHGARPLNPEWVKSLRDQCVAPGVPFFFKQWGEFEEGMNSSGVIVSSGEVSGKHATVSHGGRTSLMVRVGKKAAGRLLDGRTWSEFPTPAGA